MIVVLVTGVIVLVALHACDQRDLEEGLRCHELRVRCAVCGICVRDCEL